MLLRNTFQKRMNSIIDNSELKRKKRQKFVENEVRILT